MLHVFPARGEVEPFVTARHGRRISAGWVDASEKWQYKIVWNVGPDTDLWYVEDNVAGCCYIQVAGMSQTMNAELLRAAESELAVFSHAELISELEEASDPISYGMALLRLGVSATVRFDEDIYSRISEEFYSEYEEVRDMAVWASSYAPYKEYRPDLEELKDFDSSEKVRKRAKTVLRMFDHMGVE